MKKLRKELTTRNPSTRIRFFAVGEYGERFQRPHYHIALFGEDFSDDRIYWRTSGGHRCYRSSRLEKIWTDTDGRSLGNSEIGELTIDSAAYVASYVLKKVNGKAAEDHYRRDTENGPIWLVPEFSLMSRGGRHGKGLAHEWIAKHNNQVYPHDYVDHRGHKSKPPRYYDKITELLHPKVLTTLRTQRAKRAQELATDNTAARLHDKEVVLKAKLRTKIRQLEK